MPSRRPDIRPAAALLVFAAFLLSFAGRSAAGEPVSIDVGAVYASNDGSTVDPALSHIRGKIRAMFNYSSFRMLERRRQSLAVGQSGDFELPGRRNMRISPLTAEGNKVRLAVQIQEAGRNLLTTTLGLRRGGMVLVGGPAYESGVLILIIAAD